MSMDGELDAGGLVPSIHVETMLAHHSEVLRLTRDGLAMLLEADRVAVATGFESQWLHLATSMEGARYRRFNEGSNDPDPTVEVLATYRKKLDAAGWNQLLNLSGLRSFMDAIARAEWSNTISEGKTPPLNLENIGATFEALHGARGDMVERGVIEVFRKLSFCYKTNSHTCIGRKLIVSHVRSYHSTRADSLDDLVRALCLFDGKPEPDHRHAVRHLIEDADRAGKQTAENDYFSLRWFKNGNAHLTFKPSAMPLVDKLNAILTRHFPGALPAPRP